MTPAPILVEGGHYTLWPDSAGGELVEVPRHGGWSARVTPTTRSCFERACHEVREARKAGLRADVGLMVGDLALPAGARDAPTAWALPASYREVVRDADLDVADVRIWGEAFARNQGKRRLLDDARHRGLLGADTYAAYGWALLDDGGVTRLASDASLDWDDEVRTAALARGVAPLCPLVLAGLKRAIFRCGYASHVAIYAYEDDTAIAIKLRAAAAIVAQLWHGAGVQIDRLGLAGEFTTHVWDLGELVAPGARTWAAFLAEVRAMFPAAVPLEEACPTPSQTSPSCLAGKTNSPCLG